jgi:hypothetical protein
MNFRARILFDGPNELVGYINWVQRDPEHGYLQIIYTQVNVLICNCNQSALNAVRYFGGTIEDRREL